MKVLSKLTIIAGELRPNPERDVQHDRDVPESEVHRGAGLWNRHDELEPA